MNNQTTPKVKVCIIIPAFNEADVISEVIKNVKQTFSKTKYDYTVLVIDDGSEDNTALLAEDSGAKLIKHILNSGAGGATATGLSYANQNGYNIAATMDADGQHKSDDVLKGVNILNESKNIDLLIGSRLIDSSGMSKVKVIGNKGLSLVTNLIFGISSTDSQSGLRVFSEKALKSLRWKTNGYEFCSEMLWRAKQIGLRIDEYPIQAIYTDYSKSKGQNNWNAINIVGSLIRRRLTEILK